MEGLIQAGRVKSKKVDGRGKQQAETMISQGWLNIILWHSNHQCYVPSQSSPQDTGYLVDLLRATCECPAASQEGIFLLPCIMLNE